MNVPHESARQATQETQREPRELERESDAIRDDLEQTLGAIERRVSPREIVDRSLGYLQDNGSELLEKIGATVSKNPLPLLVTTAGLVWLFASARSAGSQRTARSSSARRDGDYDPLSQSFRTPGEEEGRLKRKAHQTLDAARSRASSTWNSTRDHAREYGDDVGNFIAEQPLACGAIALATGALIGASFPASEYERDLVARAKSGAERVLDQSKANGGSGETASGPH